MVVTPDPDEPRAGRPDTLPATVAAIAAMEDPGLRNLRITRRCHELALQLRDAGMAEDATWCGFAV
jgi:hypothetical protein